MAVVIYKWFRTFTVVLLGGLAALAHAATALDPALKSATPTSITIATGEYAPWTAEHSRYGGMINRVIREAFERKNIHVQFRYLPWKRALEETRIGAYAATSFWFNVPQHERDFFLSDPISSHRELLFRLASNPLPRWKTVTDLSAFTFGATRGYEYTPTFTEAARAGRLRVEEAISDEVNFQRLLSHRIAIFPMDEVAATNLLSNQQKFPPAAKAAIIAETTPLRVTTGHLLFPRTTPAARGLHQLFNEGLAEMRADGTLNRYREEMLKGVF